MSNLKKVQVVVQVLDTMCTKTATIVRVSAVKKGIAHIEESSLQFNASTLQEHEPAGLMGCSCYLIPFDGGEVERWGLNEPS